MYWPVTFVPSVRTRFTSPTSDDVASSKSRSAVPDAGESLGGVTWVASSFTLYFTIAALERLGARSTARHAAEDNRSLLFMFAQRVPALSSRNMASLYSAISLSCRVATPSLPRESRSLSERRTALFGGGYAYCRARLVVAESSSL